MSSGVEELPDARDLLSTVRDFLQDSLADFPRETRFGVQIAIYLLKIVDREIAAAAPEVERPQADPNAVARRCREIRTGEHDARWDEALAEELDAAVARVRIARPGHLAENRSGDPLP